MPLYNTSLIRYYMGRDVHVGIVVFNEGDMPYYILL